MVCKDGECEGMEGPNAVQSGSNAVQEVDNDKGNVILLRSVKIHL